MVAFVITTFRCCCGDTYDIKTVAQYCRSRFEPGACSFPTVIIFFFCILYTFYLVHINLDFEGRKWTHPFFYVCHASSCSGPVQGKFSFNESLNEMFADFRSTSVLRVIHVCRALIYLRISLTLEHPDSSTDAELGLELPPSLIRVKLSHYRSEQTLSAPGDWGFQNFCTFRIWRWQGCQPYGPAAFTRQEIFLVIISVSGWVDSRAIVR